MLANRRQLGRSESYFRFTTREIRVQVETPIALNGVGFGQDAPSPYVPRLQPNELFDRTGSTE